MFLGHKRFFAGCQAERVEIHQAVDRRGRHLDVTQPGEGHQLFPRAWRGLPLLGEQVGAPKSHWCGGIDGERPLTPGALIAGVRQTDGVRGLIGEESGREMFIERQKRSTRGGLVDAGMVEDQQVVVCGQLFDRRFFKGLQ